MKENKLLSISVAAYNAEKYIEKALNSLTVSAEVLNRLEVLVVDDGSKDGTGSLAQAFADRYPESIRLIRKENGGYGSTVNASIREATGKYFKLLDADDWFEGEHLAEFLDYLEGCQADLVLSPYREVYEQEDREVLRDDNGNVPSETVDLEASRISGSLAMHEMAVRTGLLQDGQMGITEHCFYTDTEFVIRALMRANTVSRFGKSIYCYRLGSQGQSVSHAGLKRNNGDAIRLSRILAELVAGMEDQKPGAAKMALVQNRLNRLISLAYTGLLLQDDVSRKTLRDFDDALRTYEAVYRFSGQVKRIRLMRRTGFLLGRGYRKLFGL